MTTTTTRRAPSAAQRRAHPRHTTGQAVTWTNPYGYTTPTAPWPPNTPKPAKTEPTPPPVVPVPVEQPDDATHRVARFTLSHLVNDGKASRRRHDLLAALGCQHPSCTKQTRTDYCVVHAADPVVVMRLMALTGDRLETVLPSERAEAVTRLARMGMNDTEIGLRADCTPRAVIRIRQRLGIETRYVA